MPWAVSQIAEVRQVGSRPPLPNSSKQSGQASGFGSRILRVMFRISSELCQPGTP